MMHNTGIVIVLLVAGIVTFAVIGIYRTVTGR